MIIKSKSNQNQSNQKLWFKCWGLQQERDRAHRVCFGLPKLLANVQYTPNSLWDGRQANEYLTATTPHSPLLLTQFIPAREGPPARAHISSSAVRIHDMEEQRSSNGAATEQQRNRNARLCRARGHRSCMCMCENRSMETEGGVDTIHVCLTVRSPVPSPPPPPPPRSLRFPHSSPLPRPLLSLAASRSLMSGCMKNVHAQRETRDGPNCGVTRQTLAQCVHPRLAGWASSTCARRLRRTSRPPSVTVDVFPAASCDCASRRFHNSHGFVSRCAAGCRPSAPMNG